MSRIQGVWILVLGRAIVSRCEASQLERLAIQNGVFPS
jgi:hypothetical protein